MSLFLVNINYFLYQHFFVKLLTAAKGFWAEMLGVGDFYYELGVQIVEVCLATSHRNGGLIGLDELRTKVLTSRGRKSQDISL